MRREFIKLFKDKALNQQLMLVRAFLFSKNSIQKERNRYE